jgi:hypothetical protein
VRILLDTNILVSGLISRKGPPGLLLRAWLFESRFELVTSEEQIAEFRRVLGYVHLQRLITPAQARDVVDNLDARAFVATDLPTLDVSPDPDDNVILATAVAGEAELVVTGDKSDLLFLDTVLGIPLVTARDAVERLGLGAGE